MSKIASKAIQNTYCQSRYKAAKFNERLSSREGAAEETGIERTRLARIELGTTIPYPEEVVIMADVYKDPALKNNFCRTLCPLGKEIPHAVDTNLDRISLKALSAFRQIEIAKNTLLDITEDGVIDDSEKEDLQMILKTLEQIADIAASLKLWIQKNQLDEQEG